MNREIAIRYYDANTAYVNGKLYSSEFDIFGGYTTESLATQLQFSFPSDWSGTYSIGLKPQDGTMTYTVMTITDDQVDYDLPTQAVGQLEMVVKVVDTATIITRPVYFKIDIL